MRILLTNDDGYQSRGIAVLESFLAEAGHEIWVCAPSKERSASSHAMTLRGEITITEYGPMHYHCSGTPADCMLYARKGELFSSDPDLVISGINHGYNISTDILYSGTVGAAREAVLTGLKAMALSCTSSDDGLFVFEKAAQFVVEHLEELYPLCSSECILNINVPAKGNGQWKPAVMSYLDYHDAITRHGEGPQGTPLVFSLNGGIPPMQKCNTIETDFQAVSEGFVSITALSILPPIEQGVQQKLIRLAGEKNHG
ncbi:5'/3'-nucleotidase SurE [Sphaerochaeta sp. PS]|uniref:5'/3'-nucleotidase SurE n=1 Tax=Sphaerochaeta sp. PS TaxID=3076336 RepID=UPI0028A379C6|nr:5'/3'-nucleotidase SurE [Sphaerochaeta sp. PS]MDT4760977.1 5'/3'-nucleotidase SurE [Sphaerochaeta sp. PS]